MIRCCSLVMSLLMAMVCTQATSKCVASAVAADPAESTSAPEAIELLVVVGAAGSEEYREPFRSAAQEWIKLAKARSWKSRLIDEAGDSRDQLQQSLATIAKSASPQVWIVYIGHATSERSQHKLNLVGPDVSSKELSEWFKPIDRPLVFIACSSSSAPFLVELSGAKRIVITATKSGNEKDYSRFGGFLAASLLDPATDIDHDDEVSLLEAFLAASARTETAYREMSRLASEHALLDDNGDKLGTGAEFFRGTQTIKTAQGGKKPDGAIASKLLLSVLPGGVTLTTEQLSQRAEIESKIETLKSHRPNPPTAEYWNELELLLLELAKIGSAP